MNNSNQTKAIATEFDIHKKLKSTGAHWSYCRAAQPHQDGFNYEFNTILVGDVEFAIYERHGNYFVLVDFFKNYDDACPEAKRIIDDHPDLKIMCQNRAVN
ncbi:hypothetical protein [Kosakonia radicincitans]|uniref:hypothetical protein n=1 Tax=Kosakonia radicincitans TaxID=283686 RepID=UPI001D08E6BC|nr:hypothetical protein [Kosakonia radicincitans]